MISFCTLEIGDRFIYAGVTWVVTELVRVGNCGCISHSNANQEVETNIAALFNCDYEVEKL